MYAVNPLKVGFIVSNVHSFSSLGRTLSKTTVNITGVGVGNGVWYSIYYILCLLQTFRHC